MLINYGTTAMRTAVAKPRNTRTIVTVLN